MAYYLIFFSSAGQLGDIGARKLKARLSDLEAASHVTDFLTGNPHPLTGDRLPIYRKLGLSHVKKHLGHRNPMATILVNHYRKNCSQLFANQSGHNLFDGYLMKSPSKAFKGTKVNNLLCARSRIRRTVDALVLSGKLQSVGIKSGTRYTIAT